MNYLPDIIVDENTSLKAMSESAENCGLALLHKGTRLFLVTSTGALAEIKKRTNTYRVSAPEVIQ